MVAALGCAIVLLKALCYRQPNSMALLLLYVGLALAVSFLCSVLEAVLLSVTTSYMARLEQEGKAAGAQLRVLKSQIDRPLAAILSLNTIAHTIGAAGAGAQAQTVWESEYPHAVAVFSIVLTLLILVTSEIIPKSLGAMYWRRLAPYSPALLRVMIVVLYPFVILSEQLTRLLGKRSAQSGTISREEFRALAQLGHQQGVFDASESRILLNLFRAGQLRAHDIMTPRTVLHMYRHDTTLREIVERDEDIPFSRIPVWRNQEDDVMGYALKSELLLHAARGELDRTVDEFIREILIVPSSISVAALLERLLDRREHTALVVDEYGGVEGVATMEDVVETLIGMEIVDEHDAVQDMREMARARWYARAQRLGLVPPESEPPPHSSE